jgi:hypothetical protein
VTVLQWPQLPPPDREALRTGLHRLLSQVTDGELTALDTLDDLFTRVIAALSALLDSHEPDEHGHCHHCPAEPFGCEVVETVHQYLNQPLNLLWWHLHRNNGVPLHLDDVAIWTTNNPAIRRQEHAHRPWTRCFNPTLKAP